MQEQDSTDHRDHQPGDKDSQKPRPEGPHAREDLTDREKTPGTGSLPDDQGAEGDVGPD